MKLRLHKRYTNKMLHFYTEELSRKFPGIDITSVANQYRLTAELHHIQAEQVGKEPQSDYWKMPVKIVVIPSDGIRPAILSCEVDKVWEQENCLYLDFDAAQ